MVIYFFILGTFIINILLLVDSGNNIVFKYWDIVFPLDMPFYSTMVINCIYIFGQFRKIELEVILRIIHFLNRFNAVYMVFQFSFYFIFEIWKVSNSEDFFYGYMSTNIESIN
jgi:hypothetical protein